MSYTLSLEIFMNLYIGVLNAFIDSMVNLYMKID